MQTHKKYVLVINVLYNVFMTLLEFFDYWSPFCTFVQCLLFQGRSREKTTKRNAEKETAGEKERERERKREREREREEKVGVSPN